MMTTPSTNNQANDPAPLPPPPIALTPEAADMVKQTIQDEGLEDVGLRVGVFGGGCAGLQYQLDFDETATDTDFTFELNGVRVFVDPYSAAHLQGTTIKYVDGPGGTGFKFDNPNTNGACGCGMAY